MRVLPFLAGLLPNLRRWESSISYNDGQWTPTTDTWWTPTPTTSYWYGYTTYYTYSTSTSCITYAPTYIVTITSIIPCPVTVYTTVYECSECCDDCQPTTTYCDDCEPTTTYCGECEATPTYDCEECEPTPTDNCEECDPTTDPPDPSTTPEVETIATYTSNGYVIVVVTTIDSGTVPAQSNVQVIYANECDKTKIWDGSTSGGKLLMLWTLGAIVIGTLAVIL